MFYFQTLVVLLASVAVLGANLPSVINADIDGPASNDIEDSVPVSGLQTEIKSVPQDLLQEMEVINVNGKLAYHAGQRTSGDRLIARGAKNQYWPTVRNVALQIKYPPSGFSAFVVTYIYCDVNQSSNSGKAYITGGGIGQHYIYFTIEAYSTTYMNWACQVYGR